MNNLPCEREFDFTLVLDGINELTPEIEEALLRNANDATLSLRAGRPFMNFSRRSDSMTNALLSAIQGVKDAGIGASVLRVDDCNLVTQSEIARRIGKTRQYVHQLMTGERGPGGFPYPSCGLADQVPLWFWCEVAHWLWENNLVRECLANDAEEVDMVNSFLDRENRKHRNPTLFASLTEWFTNLVQPRH